MATFRVGQRVRIIGAVFHAENIGRETVITAIYRWGDGFDYRLDFVDPDNGKYFWALEDHLAPIQPKHNKVIAWSECLWQPDHLRESFT